MSTKFNKLSAFFGLAFYQSSGYASHKPKEKDMAENTDNHTIKLLQEMRTEIRDMRLDLSTRIDGNTMILNMLAGFIHQHEERLEKLETK